MTRVGYDADTGRYTFQDEDGSYWESASGARFGLLTRVGDGPADDDDDTAPFLAGRSHSQWEISWRHELMPLLNFGVIIGVALLLLFWYLHAAAGSDKKVDVKCPIGTGPYTIHKGDTCWAIAEGKGIDVEDILKANPNLNCDALPVGSQICLAD